MENLRWQEMWVQFEGAGVNRAIFKQKVIANSRQNAIEQFKKMAPKSRVLDVKKLSTNGRLISVK